MKAALAEFGKDFTPLTDMRASAGYRLQSAAALLERYYADVNGEGVSVLEVSA